VRICLDWARALWVKYPPTDTPTASSKTMGVRKRGIGLLLSSKWTCFTSSYSLSLFPVYPLEGWERKRIRPD
jgi:hypothetical protein